MVYAPKEVSKVDDFMAKNGLLKIDYSIDTNGVKTIYSSRDGV